MKKMKKNKKRKKMEQELLKMIISNDMVEEIFKDSDRGEWSDKAKEYLFENTKTNPITLEEMINKVKKEDNQEVNDYCNYIYLTLIYEGIKKIKEKKETEK
jgi:SOS response regulatory protein OraA/RecX